MVPGENSCKAWQSGQGFLLLGASSPPFCPPVPALWLGHSTPAAIAAWCLAPVDASAEAQACAFCAACQYGTAAFVIIRRAANKLMAFRRLAYRRNKPFAQDARLLPIFRCPFLPITLPECNQDSRLVWCGIVPTIPAQRYLLRPCRRGHSFSPGTADCMDGHWCGVERSHLAR